MSPEESFSSDEVNMLPSVPRIRPSSGAKPAFPRNNRPRSKSGKREPSLSEKKHIRQSSHQRIGKQSSQEEYFNSEDDGADSSSFSARRTLRRTQKTRKVIEDDDDGDDEEGSGEGAIADNDSKNEPSFNDENELDAEMTGEEEDDDLMDDDENEFKCPSASTLHVKRSKTIKESSSGSKEDSRDDNENEGNRINEDSNDFTNDSGDGDASELIKGQKEILAQLEAEVNSESEDLRSESSVELKPAKSGRLTSRQRAMQGETVELEYTKLRSPTAKKKEEQQEDWDHDDEMELKRQQKARLRQMVSEKRNREKRAAMVDKVLRGVTSKRKKLTLATEARAAQVEVRLTQNEMRNGCVRYVSNRSGSTLSIPKDTVSPPYLKRSLKASYPPLCKRDPKTGKRVFPNVSTLTATE